MRRPALRTAATIPAIALIAGLALAPAAAPAQGRPAGVMTDTVTTAETSETVAVFGQIVAGRESRVAARVAGVATEVPLRVGDRVAEGDMLARMDAELFEIGLAEAEAQVGIAEAGIETVTARLDRAERALSRAETLRENATIAEAQLEDRISDFAEARGAEAEAQARVSAARTGLRRARYDLENATVRAPFDGVVTEVATEIGQFVAAGSEIATLIDLGAMEVEANVPARFVAALAPGQEVGARSDVGDELRLAMRAILPTESASTRTRPVRFDIVAAGAPAVGQSVTLNVPVSAPRQVAAVPKDALVQGRGGWTVFVALDGKAQPRPVEIGAALGDRFEVISGLQPGDVVVVRGNERLRPGQDIAPTPVDGGGGAAPAPEAAMPAATPEAATDSGTEGAEATDGATGEDGAAAQRREAAISREG